MHEECHVYVHRDAKSPRQTDSSDIFEFRISVFGFGRANATRMICVFLRWPELRSNETPSFKCTRQDLFLGNAALRLIKLEFSIRSRLTQGSVP